MDDPETRQSTATEGAATRDAPESVYCSDWAAAYGNPYLEPPGSPAEADVARIAAGGDVKRPPLALPSLHHGVVADVGALALEHRRTFIDDARK
jgi:hypothetical protein